MHGKITFKSWVDCAVFLQAFTGSTALFEVVENSDGQIVLEFNGGY